MKVQQYVNVVSSLLKKANTNTDTATMRLFVDLSLLPV